MLLLIQFLYPAFLYGLFLLAIPIIIHLFSFKRYKKVYFSNFNFLAALQQQKKNSSRLKNWLLLLLRLLVIAMVVVAFAMPYVNPKAQSTAPAERRQVVLYIDNSFSMTNTGSQGSLLEEAKKHLYDIINTYPVGTSFRLLTNDAPNDVLLTKEQAQTALGGLKVSGASKRLSQVFKEAEEVSMGKAATVFVLSDFQKKDCDFQSVAVDSTRETVFLVLKPENMNNIFISDVAFEQAFHKRNQTEKLVVTLVNDSDREFHNIPVTLTLNGKKKSISQVDIPAKGEQKVEMNYLNSEDGFYRGTLEVSDFPVVFDNQFFFSYGIGGNVHVLYVWQDKANPYFGKLFSDSTCFDFTSTTPAQMTGLPLAHYHLVILDGITKSSSGLESRWEEYLTNGGNIFVLPGASGSVESQNRFLGRISAPTLGAQDTNTRVASIEMEASLFKDVFEQKDSRAVLPEARQYHTLALPPRSEKLLENKQQQALLAARSVGKGNVYVSGFSYAPENSDMVYHPLFVPLLLNMASNVNSGLNSAYFLHSDREVTINSKEYVENVPLSIRSRDGGFEFIAEVRRNFSGDLVVTNVENIREAGLYEVVQDGHVIDLLAWNYDRGESQLDFSNEEELGKYFPAAKIENIKTTRLNLNSDLIREIVLEDNNKYLAPWFLLLAVIALLLEQWVWRRKLN